MRANLTEGQIGSVACQGGRGKDLGMEIHGKDKGDREMRDVKNP